MGETYAHGSLGGESDIAVYTGKTDVLGRVLDTVLARTPVTARHRSFTVTPATAHLEKCAEAFMRGARIEASMPLNIHVALASVPELERGFAYEGAGMTAAIKDLIVPGSMRLPMLRAATGWHYRHLIHVGVGWGMARLGVRQPPRRLRLDPLLQWLSLDGHGFHQLFFCEDRSERDRVLSREVSSDRDYVTTQGVGRALWFTTGASLEEIGTTISAAPHSACGPLWAGVGLAAAYAGAPTLNADALIDVAGGSGRQLSQGAIFGRAARQAHGAEIQPFLLDKVAPANSLEFCDARAAIRTESGGPLRQYRAWQRDIEQIVTFK